MRNTHLEEDVFAWLTSTPELDTPLEFKPLIGPVAHVVFSLDFSYSFCKKRDLGQVIFKEPSSYGLANEKSVSKIRMQSLISTGENQSGSGDLKKLSCKAREEGGFHKIALNWAETGIFPQQLSERKPQSSCST